MYTNSVQTYATAHAVEGDLVYVDDAEVRARAVLALLPQIVWGPVVGFVCVFLGGGCWWLGAGRRPILFHTPAPSQTNPKQPKKNKKDEAKKEGREKRVRRVTAEEAAAASVDMARVVLPLPGRLIRRELAAGCWPFASCFRSCVFFFWGGGLPLHSLV